MKDIDSRIAELLAPAAGDLPGTWMPAVKAWLGPRFKGRALNSLAADNLSDFMEGVPKEYASIASISVLLVKAFLNREA